MKQLRLLREANHLTQSELAKSFKISPSTIAMYERGERKPDPDMLLKIADFFNVSTDYLLGRENVSSFDTVDITPEDIELLKQIKKASAEKQKAIELILDIKEQAATATKWFPCKTILR